MIDHAICTVLAIIPLVGMVVWVQHHDAINRAKNTRTAAMHARRIRQLEQKSLWTAKRLGGPHEY